VKELIVEMENADVMTGCVVAKKRGTTYPGDWYAILPFGLFVALLKEAQY
jgi:hypothetical protein